METQNETNGNSKQRHGCVTAWLILMIIANSLIAIAYSLGGEFVAQHFPGGISNISLALLTAFGVVNVVSAIMLLKWKKFGFFGFVISSIGILIVNLSIGIGILQSSFGLVGIAILYGILQIKKDDVAAWTNLD